MVAGAGASKKGGSVGDPSVSWPQLCVANCSISRGCPLRSYVVMLQDNPSRRGRGNCLPVLIYHLSKVNLMEVNVQNFWIVRVILISLANVFPDEPWLSY